MREVYFVARDDIVTEVIALWKQLGATLIAADPAPNGELIMNPRDHLDTTKTIRLYVTDKLPEDVVLQVDTAKRDVTTRFYIKQRYGTPYIDFMYINSTQIDNSNVLGHGQMSMYTYYYDIISNEKVAPPESLIELYNTAAKYISRRSIVCESDTEPKRFFVENKLTHGAGPWHDFRMPRLR